MNEYISREAVLKAFKLKVKNPKKDYQRGMQDAIDCLIPEVIADIPSADVQPVKHGRWIAHGSLPTKQWSCSECKGLVEVSHYCNKCYYDFCPNCGAKMDGGEE